LTTQLSIENEGLRKRDYYGLKMWDLTPTVKPIVECTFALSPTQKATLKGPLSFDRHEGSWKYPEEIVISIWSNNKPILHEERAFNQGYYRVEINVPRDVQTRMFMKALEKLWILEPSLETVEWLETQASKLRMLIGIPKSKSTRVLTAKTSLAELM